MIGFIAADLRRHWIGVLVVTVLIALATALGVAVTLQERALRLGSARASTAFDLVIGAAGSETQLILSSVFLQPAPLPLLPGRVLSDLRADPRVEWAGPVGFGDFDGSYPIVGTTAEVLGGLGRVAEGDGFQHLGDAVVGSAVHRELGDRIRPFHGTPGQAGEVHEHAEYHVVGRMAPTGTPWDRAILVPIQAVWKVHANHDGEGEANPAAPGHDDHAHQNGLGVGHGHHHAHEGAFAHDLDPAALDRAGNPGAPAIIVKPKTIADAYKLRQDYRHEATVAVFPGEVLTRLYGTLGDARWILSAVSYGAQGLVAGSILLVIAVHVLQRRRQIGALRAFGAPRAVVFSIVWLEAFALVAVGVLAGFAVGYAAARVLSARLTEASGVAMPVEFHAADLATLATLFAAAAIAVLLPALLAYRQSPAQALRS